jgi:hypothetical protein
VLAVLTAVLVVVFVLRLARRPGARVNLGDQEFVVGRAAVFAAQIARTGPLIFPPPRGRLVLYVQHLGTDPAHGWLAFSAHPPDETGGQCVVRWRPAQRDLIDDRDHCRGTVYPADGRGLLQYAARVDPGANLIVNLRQDVGTTPPAR